MSVFLSARRRVEGELQEKVLETSAATALGKTERADKQKSSYPGQRQRPDNQSHATGSRFSCSI